MSKQGSTDFSPYNKFKKGITTVSDFEMLSEYAYGITLQLLFKNPKEKFVDVQFTKSTHDQWSYSMADQEVHDIRMLCEWITFKQYAERTGESLKQIKEKAAQHSLGPVLRHPESNEKVIIWPQEYKNRSIESLPQIGQKLFEADVSITSRRPMKFEIDDHKRFDEIQKTFLKLAHSIGKPDDVIDKAKEVLFRVCLLLRWTVFEDFLHETIHEMFNRHPHKIASDKSSRKQTLSYEDIMTLSNNFSSMSALYTGLIERQIEQSGSEGRSIHGLIYFLKATFNFQEDPYKAWYILNGQRYETDYNSLIEVKEVRNAIVHNGGCITPEFLSNFPNVPHCENVIMIDDTYNTRSSLIIESIAYRIADLIIQRNYVV